MLAVLALATCLLAGLSACSVAEPAAEGTSQAALPAPEADNPADTVPEAEAVKAALSALAADTPAPSRDAVREAYASAGFAPAEVEVSQDVTPTGLAVDSIVAGAPADGQCVLGEVRSGAVTVTVVPALGSGRCLIGSER